MREIKLLSKIFIHFTFIEFFDHENVIALLDVQKPPAPTGFEDIYIITGTNINTLIPHIDLMETDMHRVIYSRQDLTDDHI